MELQLQAHLVGALKSLEATVFNNCLIRFIMVYCILFVVNATWMMVASPSPQGFDCTMEKMLVVLVKT